MSSRPSGKAFSFRLRDDERAKIEAGVERANKGKRSWERDYETIGSFIKRAALAAAEATAPKAKAKTPASGTTTRSRGTTAARVRGTTADVEGLQSTRKALDDYKHRLQVPAKPKPPKPKCAVHFCTQPERGRDGKGRMTRNHGVFWCPLHAQLPAAERIRFVPGWQGGHTNSGGGTTKKLELGPTAADVDEQKQLASLEGP